MKISKEANIKIKETEMEQTEEATNNPNDMMSI